MKKQHLNQIILEELNKYKTGTLAETAGKQVGEEFFKDVMAQLGADVTPEKLRFFKAWQRAEGTRAENNPLATTKKVNDPSATDLNTVGVKNYSSYDIGVKATADTLKLRYYTDLVDKLRQDNVTAEELANTTTALKTWSGGDGKYVARVLGSTTSDSDTTSTTSSTSSASAWEGNKQIGAILSKLGAEIVPRSGNFSSYADLTHKRGLAKKILRFYVEDDNERPAQEGIDDEDRKFTYELDGNTIKITYVDNNEIFNIETTDKPGQVVLDPQSTTASDVLDWFQTAADWAGFIPGYGDVIDLINASVYFARGKNLEGVLSLLGAIPFVGSVLSVSMKSGFKLVKGSATKLWKALLGKNVTTVAEVLADFTRKGIIPESALRQLAKAGDPLAAKLINSKKYISKIAPDGVIKHLDDSADMLKTLSKAAGDQSVSFATKVVKAPRKGIMIRFIKVISPEISEAILKSIAKNSPGAAKEITSITALAGASFTKRLMKDPELLAGMIKSSRGTRLGAESTATIISKLKQMNPDQYADIVKQVTSSKSLSGNPYWIAYVNDALMQTKRAFDPTLNFQVGKLQGGFLKWSDIFYNEFQDLFYKAGFTDQDDKSAVIVPTVAGILSYLPDTQAAAIDKVTSNAVDTYDEYKNTATTGMEILQAIQNAKSGE